MTINVKIFTMQKDEEDILEFWIKYHSRIVGLENIFVIDNGSRKESLDILYKYKELGLHLYHMKDYSKKGDYICDLIRLNPSNIAIPLDLDEFIGICSQSGDYLSLEEISKELSFLSNSHYSKFSFSHYLTSINTELYYENPIIDVKYFTMENYKNNNKKFFKGNVRLLSLDHGNHKGVIEGQLSTEYHTSKLFLFHFHYRGVIKLVEKCKNDILGLGSVRDIDDISELKTLVRKQILGYHNIETYLKFIEYGTYSLLMTNNSSNIFTNVFENIII